MLLPLRKPETPETVYSDHIEVSPVVEDEQDEENVQVMWLCKTSPCIRPVSLTGQELNWISGQSATSTKHTVDFVRYCWQLLEEEVERLTEMMESTGKPNAFDLCRRGAILRKVTSYHAQRQAIHCPA